MYNCAFLDLHVNFEVFFKMDGSSRLVAVATVFMLTFGLNVFFGYFRKRSRKYSLKWFLFIHLPIPFIAFARLYSQLDWRFIPLFLVAAVAGQIVGGKVEM